MTSSKKGGKKEYISKVLSRQEARRHNKALLDTVNGLPWGPSGRPEEARSSQTPSIQRGDALTAGARIRGLYVTEPLLRKFGRTTNCPKCEELGTTHSAECRARIEELMVKSGEAFRPGEQAGGPDIREVEGPKPELKRARSDSQVLHIEPNVPDENHMESSVVIGMIALAVKPEIELWRDRRAWHAQKSGREEQIKGRTKEVQDLVNFDAVEDTNLEKGQKLMI